MPQNLVLQLLLLLQLLIYVAANHCEFQEYCPHDTKHVTCANIKGFHKSCGPEVHKLIPVNGQLRLSILQHYNIMRNLLSSGLFNTHAAARMPTTHWDDYLATTAELLARHCDRDAKLCSNSKVYNFVPTVEISTTSLRSERVIAQEVSNHLIPAWFSDFQGCRMNNHLQLVPIAEGTCVGHYMPMIQDHGDRIGCALRFSYNASGTDGAVTLVCNLSRASVNGMLPFEVSDVPASRCTSGRHPIYKFLCSDQEPVDYNYVLPPRKVEESVEEGDEQISIEQD